MVFSLFSNRLTEDEKSRMAGNLLTQERPSQYKLKKPDFPKLHPNTTLTSLVGPLSWSLFDEILQVGTDFLHLPPGEWESNGNYCEAGDFVRNLKVIENEIKFTLNKLYLFR